MHVYTLTAKTVTHSFDLEMFCPTHINYEQKLSKISIAGKKNMSKTLYLIDSFLLAYHCTYVQSMHASSIYFFESHQFFLLKEQGHVNCSSTPMTSC